MKLLTKFFEIITAKYIYYKPRQTWFELENGEFETKMVSFRKNNHNLKWEMNIEESGWVDSEGRIPHEHFQGVRGNSLYMDYWSFWKTPNGKAKFNAERKGIKKFFEKNKKKPIYID